jgi:hypothetical protein
VKKAWLFIVINLSNMKRFITFLFGLVFLSNAGAQTLIDSVAYNKGLRMIASATTVGDHKDAGNYFAEMTTSKPEECLLYTENIWRKPGKSLAEI